jgi:hypothetical protein
MSHCAMDYVFAFSPPFSNQEITDPPDDEYSNTLNIPHADRTNHSDIRIVDYLSDGKFLNATFWLNHVPNDLSKSNLTYGMSIDIDSNNATGYHGVEYEIFFIPNKYRWSVTITQWSTLDIFSRDGVYNYTDHNIIANPVKLSLDLAKLHFPDKYRVMFFTEETFSTNGTIIAKDDFTNWVDIPPPKYSMLTSPSPVELRPGERTIIGANVQSNTGETPNVNNFTIIEERAILVKPERIIPSPSFIISVPPDTRPGIYLIPILSNITAEPVITPVVGTLAFRFTNSSSSLLSFQVKGNTIATPVNLTVKVLNPLTLGEQFRNFWDTFGGFISFIGGGLAAGLGAMIVGTLRKGASGKGKGKDQKRLTDEYE